MKQGIIKRCVTITAAALLLTVTACGGGQQTKGYLMEEITPQEIDTSEEITAVYRNGSIYLLNAGRMYRMSPDGNSIQEIALSRDTDREILSFTMDADGSYYLLEKEPVLTGRLRFFLTSGGPGGPGQEEPESVDNSNYGPWNDDGSPGETSSDPNYGPWMDATGEENTSSDYGPWNDPDLQNSSDNSNYGPWNDDGSAGDIVDESGDGPWRDAGNEPDTSGGPGSEPGASPDEGSSASLGRGSTGSAAGSGSSASTGTGSSTSSGPAGAYDADAERGTTAPDGAPLTGPGNGASTGASSEIGAGADMESIPTRPDGLPAFLPILPENEEAASDTGAAACVLVRYDAQGSVVWETGVETATGTLSYAAGEDCVLVYADDAEWCFHAMDGSQAQTGSATATDAVLTAADLSEEERAAAGSDDFAALIDMQEQGRLIIKTGTDGRSALFRLFMEP